MKVRLVILLILIAIRAHSQLAVTVYQDMENSTDGTLITQTIAANSAHGGSGTWTTEKDGTANGALAEFRIRANAEAEATIRGPVSASSTTYTDSGSTRGWKMHNTAIWELLRYSPPATTNVVSMAFAFKLLNGWKSGSQSYDLAAIETTTGEFAVLNMYDGGSMKIDLHTGAGTSAETVIQTNQWYWVAMKCDVNDKCYLRVYDMSTWRTVVNTNLAFGGAAGKCTFAALGRYDNHGTSTADSYHVYDDWIIDESGSTFPLLPPGATITASSGSRTAFDEAYTNAASVSTSRAYQDTLLLPTGSNAWSSGYNIGKQLTIAGSGSNGNQTVIQLTQVGQSNPIFDLQQPYCTVSNLQLRGNSQDDGYLIILRSNWCRVRDVHFIKGFAATIQYGFGLVYNCTMYNNRYMGRAFRLDPNNQMSAYGTPYDISIMGRTNFSVWENCYYRTDTSLGYAYPLILSSQEAALWIVRHCDINNDNQFSPGWDAHGALDPSTTGVLAFQLYSNRITSVSGQSDKFMDHRGGMGLVYSNVAFAPWSRDYNLRADDDNPLSYYTPGPQVTNSYYWENYDNTTTPMEFAVEANDVSVITTNQSYYGRAPATNYVVQYPHFLREGVTHDPNASGAVPGAGGESATTTIGSRYLRAFRWRR